MNAVAMIRRCARAQNRDDRDAYTGAEGTIPTYAGRNHEE